MSFRDCLMAGVEQGAITRAEAEDLAARFDEEFAQAKLALGDDAARKAAKDKVVRDLRAEAYEDRRVVLLTDARRGAIKTYVQAYRNTAGRADIFEAALKLIENYGYAGIDAMAGRARAIISLAHGELADILLAFKRTKLLGRRPNTPLAEDVVRAIHGETVASPEAGAMAKAIADVFEALRQRFNAAGGAIGKIEGGYLPQNHDARALLKAGRETWKDFVRPRLDLERMRDPLTLDRFSPERLEQALDASFDAIVTDGWASRRPEARAYGRGALANQRAEHRFLHFKGADDWLAYNREFGKGDPIRAIFDHINGMARDIAAMETFGPNPNAMIEWLKQAVQNEAAKALAGKPSLYDTRSKSATELADQIGYIPWRIDSVYQYVRGRNVVSNQLRTGFGTVRNLITSSALGATSILAALSDPFVDRAARHITGMPALKALYGLVQAMAPRMTREEAVRSGIILDDFLHMAGDEARYAATMAGSEWSRWLADRTVTWWGLNAITQARKHVFARDFEAVMADHAGGEFWQLPAYLKRSMEGYGLDRTDWDVMRSAALHRPQPNSAGFLRPIDVSHLADSPALAKVQQLLGIDAGDAETAAAQARAGAVRTAEKYLAMILGQTERAVPTGTARARSYVTGLAPRGTFIGEALEGGLQFKSFVLSFTTLQAEAVMHEVRAGGRAHGGSVFWGLARGAGYAGSLVAGLTLPGALYMWLKDITDGKDPQAIGVRFSLQALATGGGFGLLGDFMFADLNRFGYSLGEQLAGPVPGLVTDVVKLGWGNVQQAMQGKDTHVGREAVGLAKRYTPVFASGWPVRAAYQRVFLDQLQYLLDPEAHKASREQESRVLRERGTQYWWRPGHVLPDRAPNLANPFGR